MPFDWIKVHGEPRSSNMGLHTVVILLDLHEICKGIILISFFFNHFKENCEVWSHGSAVKNTCYPRGPVFNSKHLHGVAHSGLWLQFQDVWHLFLAHTYTHAHTYMILNKFFKKQKRLLTKRLANILVKKIEKITNFHPAYLQSSY